MDHHITPEKQFDLINSNKKTLKLKLEATICEATTIWILIALGAHAGSIWHHHITLENCVLFKTTFGKLFVGSGQPRFDKAL